VLNPLLRRRHSSTVTRRLLPVATALFLTVQSLAFFHVPISFMPVVRADTGAGAISLTTSGTAATENFDSLSNTAGSTTNSALPTG
jgi:hypothetical protein